MKKNYFFILFLVTGILNAQYSIDFDNMNTGNVTPQSTNIVPWPGGVSEPQVSVLESFSIPNSMLVREQGGGLEDDVIFNLGNKTQGIWKVSWMMFVPTGKTAYWNIQENVNADPAQWNGDFYVGQTGSGGNPGVITHNLSSNFVAYPQNTWFLVEITLNVDSGLLSIKIDQNDLLVNETYPGNKLGAINFYSIDVNARFHIDNFELLELCTTPSIIDTNAPDYICEGESASLTVASQGSSNNWYDAATAGNWLGSGSSFQTGTLTQTTSFWVEAINETGAGNICSSEREEVIVVVIDIPEIPAGDSNQEFIASETLADLDVQGTQLNWYADSAGNTSLPDTTPLIDGFTYYVSQSTESCESAFLEVTVTETLGTNELLREPIVFYTNPVKELMQIETNKPITEVSVYTFIGQKLGQYSVNSNSFKLSMDEYSSGIYLVRISFGEREGIYQIIKE